MFKMGSDFHYSNADLWFRNLDILIERVNGAKAGVFAFYSTPELYLKARAAENLTWPVYTNDFFPYADCKHCYWTGYYSSRPSLKILERRASSFLQVLRHLQLVDVLSHPRGVDRGIGHSVVALLEEAVGVANHHDAVTGTSKQHVAEDYKLRLSSALSKAENFTADILGEFALKPSLPSGSLHFCRLVNESVCPTTQGMVPGDSAIVVVYNPRAKPANMHISILLSSVAMKVNVTVRDSRGDGVRSQLIPTPCDLLHLRETRVSGCTLHFQATHVRALSSETFIISLHHFAENVLQSDVPATITREESVPIGKEHVGEILVSNGLVSFTIDRKTGLLKSVSRLDGSGARLSVSQDFSYYRSAAFASSRRNNDRRSPYRKNSSPDRDLMGERSEQSSGAYIFRPASSDEVPNPIRSDAVIRDEVPAIVYVGVVRGEEVSEVRQVFSSWTAQTIRLLSEDISLEFEWTVGPIPVGDGTGKEIVSIFRSSLDSGEILYTDSNSREFVKRVRNKRPSWNLVSSI